jgi:hypothetical protein
MRSPTPYELAKVELSLLPKKRSFESRRPNCVSSTGADSTADFFMPIFSFGPGPIRIDRSVSIVGFAGMSGVFP